MNKATITYLILCAVCWLVLGYAVFFLDKGYLHLALQLPHDTLTDIFFKYYSSFAEWLLYVLMLIPLCFKRLRMTLTFALAEGLSAIIVQTIKHIWNMPRPVTWFTEQFGNADMLTLVEGVRMNMWHSFPSGHTATFFAFFTVAVWLLTKQQWTKDEERTTDVQTTWWSVAFAVACFVLAATGGYSRIYLSQHFTADVLAGSIIGTSAALAAWAIVNKIQITIQRRKENKNNDI